MLSNKTRPSILIFPLRFALCIRQKKTMSGLELRNSDSVTMLNHCVWRGLNQFCMMNTFSPIDAKEVDEEMDLEIKYI